MALILRYGLFAAAAILANLLSQMASARLGPAHPLWIDIAAGTAVGLVFKYILDKRWIFHDPASGLRAHGRRFPLYVLMGVATTAIFWSTELLFHQLFGTEAMRLAGGALGLVVGYVVKYRLDRRFVFTGVPA